VSAWHIYFPDPWPKAHHARYRLLTPAFARDLAESLVPDGRLHLATDSEAYALETVEALSGAPGLVNALPAPGYAVRTLAARPTVFEERWRAAGREILRLEFRKPGAPARSILPG
jgi:tRNA (guanine-N7-)-methyltransferase